MQQVLVLLALRWICADEVSAATVGPTGLECDAAAAAAAVAVDNDDPDDGGLTRCV